MPVEITVRATFTGSDEKRNRNLVKTFGKGTVLRWLKHDGDLVFAGEPLVELETRKVNLELVAPCLGVLRIVKHDQEPYTADDVLATIETLGVQDAG
jgi:pyruvate/2-oxoglutarate dehydrogenase complex dihydrolipoamide acyltransferase (E2) component